ncbi:MAG: hypothetical protein L6V93_12195 [Clostridiales bacterium]|nr:MAG: hypothetical protein L6V93_12195 [Clostridiales bacterium]
MILMQTPSLKSFLKPILYLVLFFVILTYASKLGAVYAVIAFLAISRVDIHCKACKHFVACGNV